MDGALKCIHCDSYQNFHRYFTISSTVLSLLVALVSVSGLVIPKIVELFESDDSYIEFSPANSDKGSLYVLVTNTGKRAGTFNKAWLIIPDENDKFLKLIFTVKDFDKGASYIPKDSSKLITLLPDAPPVPIDKESYFDNNEYRFRGFYSSVQGTTGNADVVSWKDEDTIYYTLLSSFDFGTNPNKQIQPSAKASAD